jgi:HPt (histidine-containing phosphotransfer) domain-containing protein
MNQANTVVDLDRALQLVGNDRDLLELILDKFWNRYPELIESIHAALAAGDCVRGRDAAHSLKGNAGYIAAGDVQACAARLEMAFKEGRIESARADCAELEAAGEQLRAHPAMSAWV